MGHETRHPIRKRLTQALTATLECLSREAACLPTSNADARTDERQLREWVLRHHAQYGLDPIWILTGVGPTPPTRGQQDVSLRPVFAMTSIDPHTGAWRPDVVDRIALGPELIHAGQFVVRMEDRSMEPNIHQGAYLIVDPQQTRLPDCPPRPETSHVQGRIFAVEMPGQGLVARIVQVEQPSKRIVLSALATGDQPHVLPPEHAHRLVKGRVIRIAQPL